MINIIRNNIDEIIDACQKHHVKSLYLFGSAAREKDFNEESDIDFLVDFEPLPLVTDDDVLKKVTNSEELGSRLQSITKKKVDLIQETNIRNKFLRYFINKEKKLLYGLS
jgi:predicted nucleotidyltransferase